MYEKHRKYVFRSNRKTISKKHHVTKCRILTAVNISVIQKVTILNAQSHF